MSSWTDQPQITNPIITEHEQDLFAGGIGYASVEGSESGGRLDSIGESEHEIELLFAYIASSGSLLTMGINLNRLVKLPKKGTRVERVDGALVLRLEKGDSTYVLYPNPKKIIAKVWPKKD